MLVFFLDFFNLIKCHWANENKINPRINAIFVSNHPTILDAIFLTSKLPISHCIVTSKRSRNILIGPIVNLAGWAVNSNTKKCINSCLSVLSNDRSLLVFPEGTRSYLGKTREFKKGFSYIAIQSKKDVIPVYISCDKQAYSLKDSWFSEKGERIHINIEVGNKINAVDCLGKTPEETKNNIKDETLLFKNHIQAMFIERLNSQSDAP